ncbi:MAG: tetratricopeptide repeat protein [Gemmatimonadota bacterium]|nr:tetratricopeptide repeat protein [Gemmatimonadota bacterium]
MGTGVLAGACAPAATVGSTAALPNVSCPEGVTLANTEFTRGAQTALVRAQVAGDTAGYQTALGQSLQGTRADANNPQSYYLAGQAYVGIGDYAGADSVFTRAEQICPGYAAEIEPERERAWAMAYQRGLDAYTAGDTMAALASWEQATGIYQGRPDAVFNLAVLSAERGDSDRAVERYEEALRILDQQPAIDPADTTTASEMEARVETRRNVLAGMLNVGAQRFQAEQYGPAAQLFLRLTELDPNNRDAWYNYALALYQQEQWAQLLPAAQRVVQIDPLNENAHVLVFNAHREQNQSDQALRVLEGIEALPIKMQSIQIAQGEGRSTLTGTVEGNRARAGTPVRLEFTFFGDGRTLGTQTVSVNAPASGATGSFEVAVENPTPVTSYRYRVLQ